jgi:hypothetical protein
LVALWLLGCCIGDQAGSSSSPQVLSAAISPPHFAVIAPT